MTRLAELALFALIPALIVLHQHLAPYTKVEESFNIQAVHDILRFGIPSGGDVPEIFRRNYDHFTFPGAVPRTFVGAVVLAGVAKPFIWLFSATDRQSLVRDILGAFNAFALIRYAAAVRRAFGRDAAIWYILFQASQFHVIYYASRTLPNMFAFGMTTLAFGNLLPDPTVSRSPNKRYRLALYLLTLSGVIFRSEIAVLLGVTTAYLWLTNRLSVTKDILPSGISGVLIGLLVTVAVDSFFWQQFPLWPELSGFLYNVVSGKSSDWGTEPWHFYFTNALPRLLLNPLTYTVAIPLSLALPSRRGAAMPLLIPSITYIALYSVLPHKESRFILYAVPSLTTAAALGASYIWTHRTRSTLYRLLSISLVLSVFATFFLSTFILLPASMANYPGAHALQALHRYAHNSKEEISVHMDTLACQTGVTRFLELPPPKSPLVVLPGSPDGRMPELRSGASKWHYDKTEDEDIKRKPKFWEKFDYALVEDPSELGKSSHQWGLVEEVFGFAGVRILRPGDEGDGGTAEAAYVRRLLGDMGVRMWVNGRNIARRYVTRGWWAELKLVPKLKIMKRIR